MQKGKKDSGGSDQFFQTSATNSSSCMYILVNYDKKPYDEDGNELVAEYKVDENTQHRKLTDVFLGDNINARESTACLLGR